jgi:hypothetical protein
MVMRGGVTEWRIGAAADMAAGPAQPQMHPPAAVLQTFRAAQRLRGYGFDRVEVIASRGHLLLLGVVGRIRHGVFQAWRLAFTMAMAIDQDKKESADALV